MVLLIKTYVTTQSGPNSVSPSKSDLAQSGADNIYSPPRLSPSSIFVEEGRRKEEDKREEESKKQRALLAS